MRYFIFLLVFLFACGGSDVEPIELGTAEQPIYMPWLYGTEGGSAHTTCDDSWQGGECWVPNSKAFYTKFYASTCSTWWQTRFVEVWNETVADMSYVNSLVDPNATQWYLGPIPEIFGQPAIPVGLWHQWSCTNTGPTGGYQPNQSNSDDISSSKGTIRQYKGGVLKVNTASIEASQAWRDATEAMRQRYGRDVIRHEVEHQLGHGHESGNPLMGEDHPNWFATEYWPTVEMYQRQACYNPANGGLFDDCL